MSSQVREVQVTFDCADPDALARFWCTVLGYEIDPPPPGFDSWEAALTAWGVPEARWNDRSAAHDPAGSGPRLFFQKVPEPKSVKTRLHRDGRAAPGLEGEARRAGLEAEAERLCGLGARLVEPYQEELGSSWIILADPESNEFCLD